MTKILPLSTLGEVLNELKAEGKSVVHCHGVFDLIHPGHIRHLEAAKAQGDVLVVTLTKDEYVNKGPGRPIFNERLRAESLASLQMVDYVSINQWPTAIETIRLLKPDVYVKGSDYADARDDITGNIAREENALTDVGGRIHFTNEIVFSSTKLLNSYFSVLSPDVENYLREIRTLFSAKDVINKLESFKDLRVLMVGDAIVDEYHFCVPLGMATKTSVINARYLGEEAHAGGVMCVANNMAGFCKEVTLLSCLGDINSRQEFIRSNLRSNVSPRFWSRPGAPTTVKRRFIQPHRFTKLMEVCFIDDSPLEENLTQEMASFIEQEAKNYDLLVVADFGHGMVTEPLVRTLSQSTPHLVVSAQTNSVNFGYNLITKYPRVDHIVVDEPEIRLACHDRFSPLEDLILKMSQATRASALSVTRGQNGSASWSQDKGVVYAPAFTSEALDATGAGDAYLSLAALCGVSDCPLELVGFLGNCAGAMAVRSLGNRKSLDQVSLCKFVSTLLK